MITLQQQRQYLLNNGWTTHINGNNWIHPKVVFDPQTQDYLTYGMNINHAYCYEFLNLPVFRPYGVPPVLLPSYSHAHWYDITDLMATLQKPCNIHWQIADVLMTEYYKYLCPNKFIRVAKLNKRLDKDGKVSVLSRRTFKRKKRN